MNTVVPRPATVMVKLCLIILCLFIIPVTTWCQDGRVDVPKLIYERTKFYPEGTQLSIALIRNGVVTFLGVQRTSDSLRKISNHDRIFEIGSITKVFTGVLLSDLVLSGKVKLDDPINDILPSVKFGGPSITYRQLANHTSGLPRLPPNLNLLTADQRNPYQLYDEEKLTEFLRGELKTQDPPGTKYGYSNLGAGLLGYLLSRVENVTYETLLQNKVLIPLRMTSTTTHRDRVENRIVRGLNYEGKEVPNWDLNALVGAGGILSSAEDMSKFALAQFDALNGIMAMTRKPTFSISAKMDIGLGWHIIHEINDQNWIWHNGGTGGYTSSMVLDIDRKNGVVILSNISAFHQHMANIDKLAFDLITKLIEEQ